MLATYGAIDPEDTSALITRWSTSGTDGGDFTVNEQGELRFRNVPGLRDDPADSGRDNVIQPLGARVRRKPLRLPAGNRHGHRCERASNHHDGQAGSTSPYRENGTAQRSTPSGPPIPEGEDHRRGRRREPTASTSPSKDGALTFASPPNFERPLGSGSDNNRYLVIIEVWDDIRNTDTLSIAVTVTDVNEPPDVRQDNRASRSQRTTQPAVYLQPTAPRTPRTRPPS